MKKNILVVIILIALVSIVGVNTYAVEQTPAEKAEAAAKAAAAANSTDGKPVNTTNKPGDTTAKPLVNDPLGGGKDGGSDLRTIFLNVLDVVQTIIIMLTTLYLIYAGFMFVTAKGDPARIKKARDALLWGFVGAGLILSAEVIALSIGDTVKEVFKGQ